MDSSRPSEAVLDDEALLDQLLAEAGLHTEAAGDAPRLGRRAPAGPSPLSFAQELVWLLDRASPGMTAYNIPIARRILGALDVTALERALQAIAARHEALRTRFVAAGGEPAQIVDRPGPVAFETVDIASTPRARRDERAAAIVAERVRRPFDLARDHMFRATLVRCDEHDHVLLLETHHIVADGWSLGIVFREVSAAYRAYRDGTEPQFAPLAVQFADYAAWQRETLAGEKLDRLLAYWRDRLGDEFEPLELPADFPQSAAPAYEGTQRSSSFDVALSERIARFAQRHDATPYMVVLAAYAAVLHRYTGNANVFVGSSVAARMETDTEGVVGFFNNTLVMRADLSGDPAFGELVRRVRETCLGAYDHQDVPLEKLVVELRKDASNLGQASLFNVVLTSQNALPSPFELDGARVEPFGVDAGATKFDLTLFMGETPAGLRLTARARSGLWAPATVERFLVHLQQLLEKAVDDPGVPVSRLDVMPPAERALVERCNATAVALNGADVVTLIEASAARVPQRIAVRDATGTVTYAALERRANQLAHHLRALGAGPGDFIGILLERSVDAVVALLGIAKSGAAYVPLAVDAPERRLRVQLDELGCRTVVSIAADADRAGHGVTVVCLDRDGASLDAHPGDAPPRDIDPRCAAYALFTSGSTGVPKAVVVTHANLANYVRAAARVLADVPPGSADDGLAALDGWNFALTSTLAADLGNTSLFPALCAGGTLHTLPAEVATDPHRFADYASAHRLDVLKITPSHVRALLAAASDEMRGALLPRRWLVFGGERLGWDAVDAIDRTAPLAGDARCRLLNHYGPTETTVGACTFEITARSRAAAVACGAQSVPIGHPLANVRAYVRDTNGEEAPLGVPGELWIAGAGVADGYLGRPELSAERFVGLGDARAYRTGDRVRRLSSGEIEFLGRIDTQVKIRGFRVELAEIEAVLAAQPGVAAVAVALRADENDDANARLVAYVQPADGAGEIEARLRGVAVATLPAYMVPAAIVVMPVLPLTRNGKLDRRALADPGTAIEPARSVAPRTETETALATIWCEAFKREPGTIGVTDDFFALGGHSLLAIRVLGKISRHFAIRLALRTLFEAPTIERLAEALEHERATRPAPAAGIRPIARAAHRAGGSEPSGAGTAPDEGR